MKRILKMAIALACLGGQMDATVTVFRGGQVLRDHVLEEMELWIEGDRIIEARAHADRVVDASGQILAPGYIDVQINGAFGCDFSSNPEHIAQVSQQLFQTGCTGFVPTLVTSDAATYAEVLPFLKGALGGMVLGFHLEGPFIAMERKGAHDSMHVQCQDASPDRLQEIYGDLGAVRLVTLAPEIPGALDAIRHLVAQGVVVSIGHSSADSACVDAAVDAGAVLCTHLFNAMPGLHHRELSIVGKALAERCLMYSMIVDGVHVDPGVVALSYRAHPEGMILVTDAMAAMGLEEGSYCLGSMEVEVANGRAVIAGTQTLAGSVLRMDDAVRNLWVFSGCSKVEALEAASLRPAQLLSLDEERGDLGIGKRADFVVLSQDLQLESTYYQGVEVYSADTGLLSACKET